VRQSGPPTARVDPSGRVKGTCGRGLKRGNGEKAGGKLDSWTGMPVNPESAIRGGGGGKGNRQGGERKRYMSEMVQRRLKEDGVVTGRSVSSRGYSLGNRGSSFSSDSDESEQSEEKGLGRQKRTEKRRAVNRGERSMCLVLPCLG
jgi:hypothetical protein